MYFNIITHFRPRNIVLAVIVIMGFLSINIILHSPKVFADCGVNTGNSIDWQGAVVTVDWHHYNGSTTQANDVHIRVWSQGNSAHAYPTNNIVHIDSSHSEVGAVYSDSGGGGADFSQVGLGWAGSGGCSSSKTFGHGSGVVLGYGNTSPCAGGCGGLNGAYNWALRCGIHEGNPQTFYYSAVNLPGGAASGGYWTSSMGSYPAHGGNGANGYTDVILLTYHEPTPPTHTPPPVSATLTCNTVDVNSPDSTTQPHDQYEVTITDSTSPGGPPQNIYYNAYVIHAHHPVITVPFSFTPHWQYVNLSVVDAHHNIVTGAWTRTVVSTQSVGPCYSAECSLTINTNLPGGYVLAGQTYNVTATLYNDSPSGLDLPGNTGNPSQYLEVQNNGGNFGFLSPYSGPISINGSVQVTFPMSFSSSGTLQGQAAYNGAYFVGAAPGAPGYSCSTPVNIYPPPLITTDSVSCSAATVSGWAFDPLASDSSINVEVYIDGHTIPGDPFLANQPRPDVDAAYGIGGNHGFNIAFPASYQDGVNHSFSIVALDPYGIENSGPSNSSMTGCESFHIAPGSSGAHLMKCVAGICTVTSEDPNSFGSQSNDTSVTTTYGSSHTSYYGPSPSYSPGFPGVPVNASYTYTFNGAAVSGGVVPSPTGSGRFLDQNYSAPLLQPIVTDANSAGNQYCLYANVNISDGFIQKDGTILSPPPPSTNPNPDNSTPSCDTVTNRPFFKVASGNIAAGGGFSSAGGSCTGGGTIGGWNNDSGTYDYGSSSQLSALALLNITGLASARTSITRPPTDLTFANAVPPTYDAYSPSLGGGFDPGGSQCFTSETAPTSGDSHSSTGDQTVGGLSIPVADQKSYFVSGGNVYITSNITYQGSGGGWGKISDVPSFLLDVKGGNIYISPGVTELDGIYIAEPNGATGGKIFTCASGLGSPVAQQNIFSTCNNQLTVYGNFVANQVNMMRSFGSLRDETPNPTGSITPLAPGELLSTSGMRPPQYVHECQTPTGTIYVSHGGSPKCLSGDTFKFDYGPTAPRTYYSVPCASITGGQLRYIYIASVETCPTGTSGSNLTGAAAGPPSPLICSNANLASWLSTQTCAAEVFYQTPETYLSTPADEPPSGGATQYNAITSLPPVL